MATQGIVRQPGTSRRIDIGGFEVLVHADAADTDGRYSLIETGDTIVGSGPPLHVHHDAIESFVVLEGAYVMTVDGVEHRCPAGSFVLVPKGAPHTFRNDAPRSRKLNLYTPAAMVGYFDDLAAALQAGDAEDVLDRIAGRYGMTFVGDVPDAYLGPRD